MQPDLDAVPIDRTPPRALEPVALYRAIRPGEWLLIAYFAYTAILSFPYADSYGVRAAAVSIPCILCLLPYLASISTARWIGVVRDWLPLALILFAYHQVDWFHTRHRLSGLEQSWLKWDRILFYKWRLHSLIEGAGAFLPAVLEAAYCLLYAIPPLCVGTLYLFHRRDRIDTFLFTVLMGILLAYALLPFFPSGSPRTEFPGQDLPSYSSLFRRFNLWILNRADIRSSVFPSGHVVTAFSAAFGMMIALPERKWAGKFLLGWAGLS